MMSKNKMLPQEKNFKNSYYLDPEFKKLYNKINELVKMGLSNKEIVKMKI